MDTIFLDVPYSQKDSAKALGARWNAQARKWYVSGGTELAPFAQWLPADLAAGASVPAATQEQSADYVVANTLQSVPLSQLLGQVRELVNNAFATGVWTLVEVMRVQVNNGHLYLELAERDEQGGMRAQARGMIWAARAAQILPQFQQVTGVEVAAGIKLLVRARPGVHERFGLSLEIDAIDPDYTLGDLEAKKKHIRLRLQQEGIFTANKQQPAPWDFNHVLVISPHQAAGLGDFQAEAERLQRLGVCRFTYRYSKFQGEGAGEAVALALQQGMQACHEQDSLPDAVVIIRGGGAVNDLAWLNDYALARAICLLDVPVLTGIGHERDSTVADEVAHYSFDTPSKVIAGIERQIQRRVQEARQAFAQIQELAGRHLNMQRLRVEQDIAVVQQGARHNLSIAREHSSRWFNNLRLAALGQVHTARGTTQGLLEVSRQQARQQLRELGGQLPLLLGGIQRHAETALYRARDASRQQMERIRHDAARQQLQVASELPQLIRQVRHDSHRLIQHARRETGQDVQLVLQQGKQHAQHSRQAINQRLHTIQYDAQHGLIAVRNTVTALFREVAGQGPDKTLARGFALVRDAQGQPVSSPAAIRAGEPLTIQFHRGRLQVQALAQPGESDHE